MGRATSIAVRLPPASPRRRVDASGSARYLRADHRSAATHLRVTPSMPERHELEALFVQHLPIIDRAIASLCRRQGVRGADAEDVASWIKTRIVESDYSPLRKFRGESALSTYLTVVIAMLFRDHRVQTRGRWRPSAAAVRAGPLAVRLETLVRRDGLQLHEAGELLRTARETTSSDRQLGALLGSLPERPPLRPVDVAADADLDTPGLMQSDDTLIEAESNAEHRDADSRLHTALRGLSPEDQVMLKLRFWEGRCVPDISRALGVPQKRLYRRLERSLATLRRLLESSGLSRERARALLSDVSR